MPRARGLIRSALYTLLAALVRNRLLGDRGFRAAQVLIEELPLALLDFGVAEAAVAGAVHGDEVTIDLRLLQRRRQPLRLVVRDHRILVAVDDQERRVIGRNIRHRRGGDGGLLLFLDSAAEQ